jgi:hypothetical protein
MTPHAALRLALVSMVGATGVLACDHQPAQREDCQVIFERIVEIELREMGLRDPELTKRKQADLARRYADVIGECEGRALPPGALDCLRRARSTEELSHVCLK